MAIQRWVRITKGRRYKRNESEKDKKISDFDDTLLTVIGESYQKMRSVEGVDDRQRERPVGLGIWIGLTLEEKGF